MYTSMQRRDAISPSTQGDVGGIGLKFDSHAWSRTLLLIDLFFALRPVCDHTPCLAYDLQGHSKTGGTPATGTHPTMCPTPHTRNPGSGRACATGPLGPSSPPGIFVVSEEDSRLGRQADPGSNDGNISGGGERDAKSMVTNHVRQTVGVAAAKANAKLILQSLSQVEGITESGTT